MRSSDHGAKNFCGDRSGTYLERCRSIFFSFFIVFLLVFVFVEQVAEFQSYFNKIAQQTAQIDSNNSADFDDDESDRLHSLFWWYPTPDVLLLQREITLTSFKDKLNSIRLSVLIQQPAGRAPPARLL
jgi:hypothetical protein